MVDIARVRAELPGTPEVQIVKGGLDAHDTENDNVSVIATAAVEAFLDIDPDDSPQPKPTVHRKHQMTGSDSIIQTAEIIVPSSDIPMICPSS